MPLHDSLNPGIGQGARQQEQALLRIFASLVYAEMDPNAAANDGPRTKSPTRMRRERTSERERGRLTPVGNGGGIFRGGNPGYVPRQRITGNRQHCANLLAHNCCLHWHRELELRGVRGKSEEILIEAVVPQRLRHYYHQHQSKFGAVMTLRI